MCVWVCSFECERVKVQLYSLWIPAAVELELQAAQLLLLYAITAGNRTGGGGKNRGAGSHKSFSEGMCERKSVWCVWKQRVCVTPVGWHAVDIITCDTFTSRLTEFDRMINSNWNWNQWLYLLYHWLILYREREWNKLFFDETFSCSCCFSSWHQAIVFVYSLYMYKIYRRA